MIPDIIHQTYKDQTIPTPYDQYASQWRTLHPKFDYRLWTDQDNLDLVESEYPQYAAAYRQLPYAIQRVDVARYMYLHKFGGVYADIDLEPLRSVADLLETDYTVLVLEPSINKLNTPFLVSNYWMAAPAGSKFLEMAIARALQPHTQSGQPIIDVLQSTGCLMLTELYRAGAAGAVTLLPSIVFSPYTHAQILRSRQTNEPLPPAPSSRAVHHFAGSWH